MRLGVTAAIVDDELLAGDVEISDGRVTGVGLDPAGADGIAAAGFIDLQVNGFAGVDFVDTDVEGLLAAGEALAATGVTAYQPTLVTSSIDTYWRALENIKRAATFERGAAIIGIHVEGPFLSPAFHGAHNRDLLMTPDLELARKLTEAGMTYMTLAPELPGALELVSSLIDWGVIVSCGHSDTDADTANRAYDLGARTVTHLFNAHRPLRARDPGLGGVVLTRPEVFAQMILDGHHLASETARLVTSTCRGRLVLVTDAMEAATLAEGSYQIGGSPVQMADGTVRLADGTLAGSVLTLDQAVRNFIEMGAGLEEAVAAVTTVPARLLGRADLGSSRPGSRADLVVLDEAGEVMRTVIAGEERFRR